MATLKRNSAGRLIDKALDIRIRILTTISQSKINAIKRAMRKVFRDAAIEVNIIVDDPLDLGLLEFKEFEIVEVRNNCPMHNPSDDIVELSQLRGDATENEIVVFICKMVNVERLGGIMAGCSSFPPAGPTSVMAADIISNYLLAHEVGHLLGLVHVLDDTDRLMTKEAPDNFTMTPPQLKDSEIDILRGSQFLRNL